MFTHLIEELNKINCYYQGVPVIVEGKKDKTVLKKLGFTNILDISGSHLSNFAEKIVEDGAKSVIILTDFDDEGLSKALQLTKIFHKYHIIILSSVRQRIRSLFKIHKIEELSHFTNFIDLVNCSINGSITNLTNVTSLTNVTTVTDITGDDYNGKTSSIHDKIFDRSRVYNRRHSREAGRNRRNIRPD
jgi:5S rRNA maturation endonuclease (ribonuclease M5)